MSESKNNVRVYKLQSGDVFSILEKNAFDAMSNNGCGYMLVPIKRYKKVIWYKPSTWFRWIWQIEYHLID
jgi:hypothetical protein